MFHPLKLGPLPRAECPGCVFREAGPAGWRRRPLASPAVQLSASQMVPRGELARDTLAEPPFPAQFTEPRGAQEPRAAGCSAKEAGCPGRTDGRQAWQAPGSGLCLQPPAEVQVRHLSSGRPNSSSSPCFSVRRTRRGLIQPPPHRPGGIPVLTFSLKGVVFMQRKELTPALNTSQFVHLRNGDNTG